MRVDLHTHTQKCKEGDALTRVISPGDFVGKMQANNVGVCAITNHNKVDKSEYRAIKELSEDIVILPGIELDLDFEGKDRQVIVVCNPDSLDDLYEVFDNEPDRNLDAHKLEYSEFKNSIGKFDPCNIIIIAHFMNKAKGFKTDERQRLYSDLANNVLLLEPSSLTSMGFVNGHGEALSLVGSDVQDWALYNQNDLPELKFKIDSYGKFFELCSDPKSFVKNYLNGAQKNIISTPNGNIEIFDDVNVIFGEKGSGKTILLERLSPQLSVLGKKVITHMGDKFQSRYDKVVEDHAELLKIDERQVEIINDEVDRIVAYREQPLDNFIQKILTFRSDQNKNKQASEIIKRNASFSNDLSLDVDELIENAQDNVAAIEEVKKINDDVRLEGDEHRGILDAELELLGRDVQQTTSDYYHAYFIDQGTEDALRAIKESVKRNSDAESPPSNLGFSKLVGARLERVKSNKRLLTALEALKDGSKFTLGRLPSKGDVTLEVSICVYNGEVWDSKSVFNKNKVVRDRWMLEKIKKFKPDDFKYINQYFDDADKEFNLPTGREFVSHVVQKVKKVKIASNDNYEPSPGEKAILSISSILESYDFDCYLFDEVEKGLGHKYIAEFVIPKIKELRDRGKCVVVTTHDANIAVSTLPSQTVYCEYPNEEVYYTGNMYSNELIGARSSNKINWLDKAMIHLEGGDKMFAKRRNIYGQ